MNFSWIPSIRACFGLIALGSISMILFAIIMLQFFLDLEPCALCVSQRIGFLTMGVIAFIAFIHGPKRLGQRIYLTLGSLATIAGGSISARHVWIQNLPVDEQPLCGPGLGYMFETRPVFDALSLLLTGDGNCADVLLRFLGLTIPGWTLIAFIGFLVFHIWLFFRTTKTQVLPS